MRNTTKSKKKGLEVLLVSTRAVTMEVVDGEMIPLMIVLTTLALLTSRSEISIDVRNYPKLLEWLQERKGKNIPDLQHKYALRTEVADDASAAIPSAQNPRSIIAEEAFGEILDHVPHDRSRELNPFETAIAAKYSATVGRNYLVMDITSGVRDLMNGIKKIAEFKVVAQKEGKKPSAPKPVAGKEGQGKLTYVIAAPHMDDHVQKAFTRLRLATYNHIDYAQTHPYPSSRQNAMLMIRELTSSSTQDLRTQVLYTEFAYADTPTDENGKFEWIEASKKLKAIADDVADRCKGSDHVSKISVQIAANDLKVAVDAYTNRLEDIGTKGDERRNSISMVGLALPVYIKLAASQIMDWVAGKSPEYIALQTAMQEVLLDYIQDMESRHGAIEPHKRIGEAYKLFKAYVKKTKTPDAHLANVNSHALDRFKDVKKEINKRAIEIEKLASKVSGVVCEIFIAVA